MKPHLKPCLLAMLLCVMPSTLIHAQNTVVTYQGLVQSSGTPFTGVGQFKFALVTTTNTSAQATAVATSSFITGQVTGINVTFGGSGYVTPPTVTLTGVGSGATATAIISGGVVTGIQVNNPGTGYTFPPAVTIAPPPPVLAYLTHWSNDGTSVNGSEPAAAVTAPVNDGLFIARLGDATVANMTAFGADLFAQTNLQLRLWFNDGTNGFAVLQPPQPLSAAPYAFAARSATSATTVSGAVAAGQLTGTIAANNIGAGSISSVMLANGAVGSNQIAAGAVSVDKLNTAKTWVFSQTFTNPTPAQSDSFGYSVAAVGADRVLIGTPIDSVGSLYDGSASLFHINGTLLTVFTNPAPAPNDNFGRAVAAVGSDQVLIGAWRDQNLGGIPAGAAFLFSTNGTLLTTFTNPSPTNLDGYGSAVASVGVNKVLIGAFGDDLGANDAGIAYLHDTAGSLLTTFTNPTPASFDNFGWAVTDLGLDRILIGAPRDDTGAADAGVAYLFDTAGNLLTTFTNPIPTTSAEFGRSVARVGEDMIVIGAPGANTGATTAGAAYLFNANGNLLVTFTNPSPIAEDAFGYAVAAVGHDKVLVGAYLDNGEGEAEGAAYLFDLSGHLLATFSKPVSVGDSHFGFAVTAVGADHVLIGAKRDDTDAPDAGAAYLFSTAPYVPGLVSDPVAEGNITAAKIRGVLYPSQIPNLDAAKITTGVLTTNQIPDLDASKITTGTLVDARLGNNVAMQNQPNVFTTNQSFSLGSAAAPGLIFSADPDTGLFSPIANTIAFATAGIERQRISSTGVSLNVPLLASSGSVGSPAITFSGDADTGLFNPAANTLAVTTGAAERMRITSAGLLGVGTNNPAARLHVASSGATPQLHLSQNDSANAFTRMRYSVGNTNLWDIAAGGNNNLLNFFYIPAANDRMTLDTNGNLFIDGTLNPPSDRNVKQDFTPVDSLTVLEKVAALPIQSWAYKNSPETRHIGPVAQDFHAAFQFNGDDDKHISTVDADGVALAAIQGLNAKVESGKQKAEMRMANLEAENSELKQAVNELKELVQKLSRGAR